MSGTDTTNERATVVAEIRKIIAPLELAAQSPYRRQQLFVDLGLEPDTIASLPLNDLTKTFETVVLSSENLIVAVETPPESLEEVMTTLNIVGELFEALGRVDEILSQAGASPPKLDQLGAELIEHLVILYLIHERRVLFSLGVLLRLIDMPGDDGMPTDTAVINDSTGEVIRYPARRPRLRLDRLGELLSEPSTLKEAYLGDGLQTADDVKTTANAVFPQLASLLTALGAQVRYGVSEEFRATIPGSGAELSDHALTFSKQIDDITVGATLALASEEQGGAGFIIVPFGETALSHLFGKWLLSLTLSVDVDGVGISSEGVILPDDSGATGISGTFRLDKPSQPNEPAIRLGVPKGTRLDIGSLTVESDVTATDRGVDANVLAMARRSAFVLSAGEADGFLQQVLPEDDLSAGFDLGLGWATRRGVYLEGAAGLSATFPLHQSIGDLLRIDSVSLDVQASSSRTEIPVEVTTTVGVTLGPIDAVVENIGLRATVSFPEDRRGNLGPLQVDLGFRPPSGAGLSVNAAAVTGGGYLFFDPDRGQYAGTLQLGFGNIVLTAVGILTTRMPDGSEGFSLLLIITGEFPPIQLGFGFTLNAVGGLLGVNRTAAIEPLRSGIREGTLGSVLFPQDPIRNAPQIISDLNTVFPPAAGRFIVGPMARLGWGTPTLLSAELGIALELPAPIRIIIMGRISTILPAEEVELIRLRMDALGVINFDKGEASVDATLFDSRFVQFTASGDMALRANWGSAPAFALSAGGFNPRFQPPANFPPLRRLTISLATGNNPRLRLETYLAVTSNTFQVGAKLELYAAAAGFSIEGILGFDTLFQFSPFAFVADLVAGVAVKRGRKELLSVRLDLTLSGPKPWHARGKAKFKILFLSVSIPVNVKIGSDEQPPLSEGDPLGEFRAALSDPRNWSAQVPAQGQTLVSLRERPDEGEPKDGPVLVHPLSDLTVRQRAVPLGVEIQKYGNTRPRAERRFDIGAARLRDQGLRITPVTEKFAPANYFEYSDEEKLTRPAFEDLPAGVTVETAGIKHRNGVTTTLDYETEVIDDQRDPDADIVFDYTLLLERFADLAELSAVAGSPMRRTGRLTFEGPSLTISLEETTYTVATTDTLSPQTDLAVGTSYAVARTALFERQLTAPTTAAELQVVSEHVASAEEP